ncbi:hypothetical protein M407DRAFT_244194 [Tulasnella calospora MUT 4182]|uniref:Uncharacterized protein n=1 Tax=Tulasnella calospora MUT 4182 TaxID=1051891 RepID=A0A0C3Q6R5_9AGAM|nr:hypothetical protein M407DRAFT_244194 [Tulasnella calospora MUT 4182]
MFPYKLDAFDAFGPSNLDECGKVDDRSWYVTPHKGSTGEIDCQRWLIQTWPRKCGAPLLHHIKECLGIPACRRY